jgi:hypothetical protein
VTQPITHRQRQPGLADPAWPRQRDEPSVFLTKQARHLVNRLLAPDQRRRRDRQPATGAPRGPRCAARGESFGQQRREIVAHQPSQLG